MINGLKELFDKELSYAESLEDLERVRLAWLGKQGVFRNLEKALWN